MDKLMGMVGLKRVKETAITVALNVLLKPPPDIKTGTSMNFLFLGNPGSGKVSALQNYDGFRQSINFSPFPSLF